MEGDRKSIAGWVHYLTDPDIKLTLEELNALMLLHLRDNILEMRHAAEHTEGMLGAIDQLAAGLAERSGIPYATGEVERVALARQRAEQRRALQEGDHAM